MRIEPITVPGLAGCLRLTVYSKVTEIAVYTIVMTANHATYRYLSRILACIPTVSIRNASNGVSKISEYGGNGVRKDATKLLTRYIDSAPVIECRNTMMVGNNAAGEMCVPIPCTHEHMARPRNVSVAKQNATYCTAVSARHTSDNVNNTRNVSPQISRVTNIAIHGAQADCAASRMSCRAIVLQHIVRCALSSRAVSFGGIVGSVTGSAML